MGGTLQRGSRFACTALCTLWLLGACGDEESARAEASVHGVVRDAQTDERLSGVQIKFVSDTLDEASGKTNGDGEYELFVESDTPKGRISASKSGYETRVVSVYLDDVDVAIDLELTKK